MMLMGSDVAKMLQAVGPAEEDTLVVASLATRPKLLPSPRLGLPTHGATQISITDPRASKFQGPLRFRSRFVRQDRIRDRVRGFRIGRVNDFAYDDFLRVQPAYGVTTTLPHIVVEWGVQ